MSIVPLTQSEWRWNVVGLGILILKFGRCPSRTAVPALPPLTVEEWFVWEKETLYSSIVAAVILFEVLALLALLIICPCGTKTEFTD